MRTRHILLTALPTGNGRNPCRKFALVVCRIAAIVNHPLKQGDGPDSVNVLPAFIGRASSN
jgi:hypothetical protein